MKLMKKTNALAANIFTFIAVMATFIPCALFAGQPKMPKELMDK